MFTRVEDVANRALITSVAENEPILDSKLASLQSGAGLAATIPEGMRAMSVAVNDVVGVAGFVTPGTMVDVLVTGRADRIGRQTLRARFLKMCGCLRRDKKWSRTAKGSRRRFP